MSRLPVARPAAPLVTGVQTNGGATTVTWRPGGGPVPTSYAVYRLDPGAAVAGLVGSVRAQSFVDKGALAGARYCVSGLDRSANEGPMGAASDAV
jgi:hypothetical protein